MIHVSASVACIPIFKHSHADPVVCPPSLVSGNQWRKDNGYAAGVQALEEYADSPTDLEGDPDPESLSEEFVYTEKRKENDLVVSTGLLIYFVLCSHLSPALLLCDRS